MLLLPVISRLILFHHAGCQLQHQCRHRVWSVMIDITELLVYLIWIRICNCIVMFKQHLETYWTYIYQWWSDSDLACQVQFPKTGLLESTTCMWTSLCNCIRQFSKKQ